MYEYSSCCLDLDLAQIIAPICCLDSFPISWKYLNEEKDNGS